MLLTQKVRACWGLVPDSRFPRELPRHHLLSVGHLRESYNPRRESEHRVSAREEAQAGKWGLGESFKPSSAWESSVVLLENADGQAKSDQQSQNFQELGIYIFSKHCTPSFTTPPTNDTDNGLGLGQLSLATGSRGVGF